jgi:hypothetical protein
MNEPLLFLIAGLGVVTVVLFFAGGAYESHRNS